MKKGMGRFINRDFYVNNNGQNMTYLLTGRERERERERKRERERLYGFLLFYSLL